MFEGYTGVQPELEARLPTRDIENGLKYSRTPGKFAMEIQVESNDILCAFTDSRLGTIEEWTADLLKEFEVDISKQPEKVTAHDFQEDPESQQNLVGLLRSTVFERLYGNYVNDYAEQRVSVTLELRKDIAVELYAAGRAWYNSMSDPDYDITYGAVFRRIEA